MSHDLAVHLEHLAIFLVVTGLLLLSIVKNKPLRRSIRRKEIVKSACAYAEQMGGSPEQKKLHALGYAQIIDKADNGKRDYSDAELSVEIEAHLGAE